jgi:hypothetical protein
MLRITSQKKGIREPEDRLWMLFICAILCPVAFILWGVGASAGIHWVGLVFGGGILAFCSAVAAGFTINYAMDAYKELSGEVLISIMLVRVSQRGLEACNMTNGIQNSLSFAVVCPTLTSESSKSNAYRVTASLLGLQTSGSSTPSSPLLWCGCSFMPPSTWSSDTGRNGERTLPSCTGSTPQRR